MPIAVLLVIPCGIVGALGLTLFLGMNNDVYFKVGMLTTMGLVSKNAILIVEFAKDLVAAGEDVVKAALHAVELRLRPILMTSLAFGLGCCRWLLRTVLAPARKMPLVWACLAG